jgi:hypothetical protein
MADAVSCALACQQTPNGYYNLERLLGSLIRCGAEVGLWVTVPDETVSELAPCSGSDTTAG